MNSLIQEKMTKATLKILMKILPGVLVTATIGSMRLLAADSLFAPDPKNDASSPVIAQNQSPSVSSDTTAATAAAAASAPVVESSPVTHSPAPITESNNGGADSAGKTTSSQGLAGAVVDAAAAAGVKLTPKDRLAVADVVAGVTSSPVQSSINPGSVVPQTPPVSSSTNKTSVSGASMATQGLTNDPSKETNSSVTSASAAESKVASRGAAKDSNAPSASAVASNAVQASQGDKSQEGQGPGQSENASSPVAANSKPLPSLPVDEPPNLAQSPEKMAASAPPPVTPSENVTLNLINRLVQRGILTKEDAGDLIKQAKADAQVAAQQAATTQQIAQQASAAQQAAMEAAAPPSSDESVSVSYVPEIVKTEMRNEIKQDVMAAAQSEGWASPHYPEWLANFRPISDFRFRFEGDYFPSTNSISTNSYNDLDTINFNSINTGSPFNISQYNGNQTPPIGIPTYNTTQDRERLRIRFRFGADMNLGENFTSGFRVGTGQNGSPVSENQTLGSTGTYGQQGGNFSEYAIWLDRAFLKYEIGDNPDRLAAITFGRFDNPFFTPTTIMWANDIGFDGIAAQGRYKLFKGFTPFVSGGLFPVYNTDLNFSSTTQPKYASYDKYLYAAQGGLDWKITKDIAFKGAVGYYYFQNVEGQVSSPQVAYSAADQFNTDDSRPSFAQKGNTYIALRDIPSTIDNNYGTINQYQYFGLATPFHILSANGRLEYRHWEPFVVSLSGEVDKNMAWNYNNIVNGGPPQLQGPINNPGSSGTGYGGGDTAWIIQMKVGSGALQKRWDWDFGVSYRYVESDAVIDGFCDSDFGGGGTNLKGFSVGGNLALSRNVFIGARWLSATGIAGPQYKEDILQIDINSRF